MKLLLPFCLALCLTCSSCERPDDLKREIATLESTIKQDQAVIHQCETDIAALGGSSALTRIAEQTESHQTSVRPLEFDNTARERRWSAIEAGFAKLKPAAEAFKAAQPK